MLEPVEEDVEELHGTVVIVETMFVTAGIPCLM